MHPLFPSVKYTQTTVDPLGSFGRRASHRILELALRANVHIRVSDSVKSQQPALRFMFSFPSVGSSLMKRPSLVVIFWCVMFGVLLDGPGYAQQRATITDQPTCPSCVISLQRIGELDNTGDRLPLGRPISVRQDSRGRIFVNTDVNKDGILLFDSEWQAERILGRAGRGPGEFFSIVSINITAGDTLVVLDRGNKRISFFDSTLEHVRDMSFWGMPHYAESIVLPNGELVISADMPGPDAFGIPIHRVDTGGNVTHSFGAEPGRSVAGDYYGTVRAVALARDGTIWSARYNDYYLENWSIEGRLLRVFVGDRPWFRPYAELPPYSFKEPPAPRIRTVREVAPGKILVVSQRAKSTGWQEGMGDRPGHSGPVLGIPKRWLTFDSQLDLIDVDTGELLQTHIVPAYVMGFVNDTILHSYDETELDVPTITLWELSLDVH